MQVKEDFEAGLEYAEATELLDVRDVEGSCGREYLTRWSDGGAETWEDEDNLAASLVRAFEAERRRSGGGANGGGPEAAGTNGAAAAADGGAVADAAPALSR